jgi:hypothetical protein
MQPTQYPWDGLIGAWRQAAADLGIRVTAPFILETSDGRTYRMAAHVPDFGDRKNAPAGLLVFDDRWYIDSHEKMDAVFEAARSLGYAASGCSHVAYTPYRRAKYSTFLRHNAWIGAAGMEPAWYSVDPSVVSRPGSA